jgi:hypothetical protein
MTKYTKVECTIVKYLCPCAPGTRLPEHWAKYQIQTSKNATSGKLSVEDLFLEAKQLAYSLVGKG